ITQTATNFSYYEGGELAGHDSFSYTISDGYNEATGNITVNFLPFVLTVTNAADSGPGTLRAALNQANIQPQWYIQTGSYYDTLWTIQFDPTLAGQTVALSTVASTNFGPSALTVSSSVTIDATNAPGLTISLASNAAPMRLLDVYNPASSLYYAPILWLQNMTLLGGVARGQDRTDGGLDGCGGAVLVAGSSYGCHFNAYHVSFTQSQALGAPGQPGVDGGMALGGALFLTNCNSFLQNCAFWSNSAAGGSAGAGGAAGQGFGGAIYSQTSVVLFSSQLSNNVADSGGGIFAFDDNPYGDGGLSLSGDSMFANAGGDLISAANPTSYSYTDVSGSNYISSQSDPFLPSIPNITITNQGQITFSATADFDGATNYSVTVYAYDDETYDQVTNGLTLTNSGTNYTLSISPESCQGNILDIQLYLSDGPLTYESDFSVTNLVSALAANLQLQTDRNTVLTNINVLTNDCGSSLSILRFDTNNTLGEVTLDPDGTFSYDPTAAFLTLGQGKTATNSFTYTIIDASGHTATATVTIIIHGVNDVPTPSNPIITRLPGTNEVLINIASLGGDPDGDLVTLASFA